MSPRALFLFDIDGTLVRGGPARDAFEAAMLAVFGTTGPIQDHDFAGKTDPQIARELLELAGVADALEDAALERLWAHYLQGLGEALVDRPMRALPGAEPLLEHLATLDGVEVGLLTGNIRRGAELKLASAGLRQVFAVGAYGSDHPERNELPGVALARAKARFGPSFRPEVVAVIGDTPRDIECGRRHGLRTIAVATGTFTAESLELERPDAVLEDLRDLGKSLAALYG